MTEEEMTRGERAKLASQSVRSRPQTCRTYEPLTEPFRKLHGIEIFETIKNPWFRTSLSNNKEIHSITNQPSFTVYHRKLNNTADLNHISLYRVPLLYCRPSVLSFVHQTHTFPIKSSSLSYTYRTTHSVLVHASRFIIKKKHHIFTNTHQSQRKALNKNLNNDIITQNK